MSRSVGKVLALTGALAVLTACQDSEVASGPLLPPGSRPAYDLSTGAATMLVGIPQGEGFGDGQAVNNLGVVVGSSDDTVGVSHATRWAEDGSPIKLDPFAVNVPTYSGRGYAYGFGVNDAGDAVGYTFHNGGGGVEGYSMRPTLWRGGTQVLIGTLGGIYGHAYDINNSGQAVGWASTADGSGRAFRWSDETGMQPLGAIAGATRSQADAINDLGWAAGCYTASGDRAVIWDAEGVALPLSTGPGSYATGINDAGQVVGSRLVNGSSHAFLWTASGGFRDLGPGRAEAVNNQGVVVGQLGGYGAAAWSIETGIIPLPGLDGTPGNAEAMAIADDGSVAGTSLGRAVRWSVAGAALTIPRAPTDVRGTATSGTAATASWQDASGNEAHFQVARRLRNLDGSWSGYTPLGDPAADATSLADSGLVVGKTYQYRVRACNGAGCSAWVLSPSVVMGVAPVAPTAPQGTIVTATRIQVRWTDLSSNETRFELARRVRNHDGSWSGYTGLANPPANATGAADLSVVTTNVYQYRLRSCNATGCSAWVLGAAVMVPTAPAGLTTTVASPTRINLHWDDRSTNEERFEIARRQRGDGTWSSFTALPNRQPNTEGYADMGVGAATTYQYRVRACNASGCSEWLLGASATTPAG